LGMVDLVGIPGSEEIEEKAYFIGIFFLGWPGLTRVNPSDPWPDH
jgi:hypothetical protein